MWKRRGREISGIGSVAGAIGAAAYVVGDVLLLGSREDPQRFPLLNRDDVDVKMGAMLPHSRRRLAAGALVGVFATPLYLAGALDQHRGLAAGRRGDRAALAATALMTAAHTFAPFMHGSFFPYGEAFKRAEAALEAGASDADVTELVRAGNDIGRVLEVVYGAYAAAAGAATVVMAVRIGTGRTAYPRWAVLLVPPLVPMAATTALTASHVLPGWARHGLQGAGYSLGLLVSFASSAALAGRESR